jgi:hypothetical protein
METTLARSNGATKSRLNAGGSNVTTPQLELSRKITALSDLTAQQLPRGMAATVSVSVS